MTAVTLAPEPRGVGKSVVTTCSLRAVARRCGVVIQFVGSWDNVPSVTGLLFGNHIVDASSLVSLYHPVVRTPFETGSRRWCVV
jgi:hypothetical protein